MIKKNKLYRLFRPSFWKGFVSVFDIWQIHSPINDFYYPMTDKEALEEDWKAIGEDFRTVINNKRNE